MTKDKDCVVVDYGIGNVFSVTRALKQCGATYVLTADPDILRKANRVILPGVGAFKNGIEGLIKNNLVDPLKEFAATGKPLLGICLGMQIFGTSSSEFGHSDGLNLIPGKTKKIPHLTPNGQIRTIPFVGWRHIDVIDRGECNHSILHHISGTNSVYLVHSYQFIVDDTANLLATYQYDDLTIAAAVTKDNITGLQFHPEKSDQTGLAILSRFITQ